MDAGGLRIYTNCRTCLVLDGQNTLSMRKANDREKARVAPYLGL
jgi:hypothetical protein